VIAHSEKEEATPIWAGGQDAFAASGPVWKFFLCSPPDLNRPGGRYVVEGVRRRAAPFPRSALPPG